MKSCCRCEALTALPGSSASSVNSPFFTGARRDSRRISAVLATIANVYPKICVTMAGNGVQTPSHAMPKAMSIREIAEDYMSKGRAEISPNVHVAAEERPTVRYNEYSLDLPVIDLSLAETDRSALVKQVGEAATTWGFFQIVNHGLSEEVLGEVEAEGLKFFNLPREEKLKIKQGYTDNSTLEKASSLHWAEGWMTRYSPISNIEVAIANVFPDGNPALRDALNRFASASETLNELILEVLAENVGLDKDFFSKHLNEKRTTVMRWNFYPACPWPEGTLGAKGHTDGSSLTVLQQDKVGGLQIYRDGAWLGVKPLEGALVVNVGDAMHAWSNGIYKSVLHRVVLNKDVDRLSLACFLNVDGSLLISAPDQLITEDRPRLYRPFEFLDYVHQVVNLRLAQAEDPDSVSSGHVLDLLRIEN